jgi:hypothetical protein
MNDIEWSQRVAGLAVDALVDADLLPREAFEQAAAIVAREVRVRLALDDRPTSDQSG